MLDKFPLVHGLTALINDRSNCYFSVRVTCSGNDRRFSQKRVQAVSFNFFGNCTCLESICMTANHWFRGDNSECLSNVLFQQCPSVIYVSFHPRYLTPVDGIQQVPNSCHQAARNSSKGSGAFQDGCRPPRAMFGDVVNIS